MECFSAFLHFCTFMYLFFDCVKGGIRHLLILMWIQLHYNKNNFTVLEFLNFSIFDPPPKSSEKNCKSSDGFELLTSRFVVNALTILVGGGAKEKKL